MVLFSVGGLSFSSTSRQCPIPVAYHFEGIVTTVRVAYSLQLCGLHQCSSNGVNSCLTCLYEFLHLLLSFKRTGLYQGIFRVLYVSLRLFANRNADQTCCNDICTCLSMNRLRVRQPSPCCHRRSIKEALHSAEELSRRMHIRYGCSHFVSGTSPVTLPKHYFCLPGTGTGLHHQA